MSFNRLIYDSCETSQRNNESRGVLDFMLDPVRIENPKKCRHQLGLVGGANVSNIRGNLVDLETDLFGITRKASNCPCKKYLNKCSVANEGEDCEVKSINIPGNCSTVGRDIDTTMTHLPNCQTIRYKPVPLPAPIDLGHCPVTDARKGCCGKRPEECFCLDDGSLCGGKNLL